MPRERSATPLSSCVHAEGAVERLLEPLDDSPYHEDVRGEVGEVSEVGLRSSRGGGIGGTPLSYGLGRCSDAVSPETLLSRGATLRKTCGPGCRAVSEK